MAPRPRRITLIGPESTGKSELAQRLSRELGVPWVPEYAREYVEQRGNDLTEADVEPIARGELAKLDAVAEEPFAILDTDLLSTVVYARYYYGACPRWIEDEARARRADLYLLLDTDIAWKPDPARDAGGDTREDLFDAFRAALDEFETEWRIVSGDWEARWKSVRSAAVRAHVPPPPTYVLRFFFDPGSGICLWSGNDAANERFGYPVELELLPLSGETRAMAEELIARFDTSIDWDDPAGPSPWTSDDDAAFDADARALLDRIRHELGDAFEVRDEVSA